LAIPATVRIDPWDAALRQDKAKIVADYQLEGRHATVAVHAPPRGRMPPGIRGIRLQVSQGPLRARLRTLRQRVQHVGDLVDAAPAQ
jgi:hypothetical protein